MALARALVLLLPLALAAVAPAREPAAGFDVVGIGLLPTSPYKNTVNPGLGLLAGIELPVFRPLSLTARSGYIAHLERKNSWRSVVPAFGGAKLVSYSTTLYIAGEIGPAWMRDTYTGKDPARGSATSTPLAWGVGLGSAVEEHDLRVSVHFWDAEHPGRSYTFAVSLALLYFGG